MKFCFLLIFVSSSLLCISQKNGTITIKKKKQQITGLYQQANSVKRTPNQYLIFKDNGFVYQFESELKRDRVIELSKADLAVLRPVIANYRFQDSTLQIIPLNSGLGNAVEPSTAYFFGKFENENLLLHHQNSSILYTYFPIE